MEWNGDGVVPDLRFQNNNVIYIIRCLVLHPGGVVGMPHRENRTCIETKMTRLIKHSVGSLLEWGSTTDVWSRIDTRQCLATSDPLRNCFASSRFDPGCGLFLFFEISFWVAFKAFRSVLGRRE